MKWTTQLLIGGVLLVIALAASAGALLGSMGSYPISTKDLRIVGPAASGTVVPGERALQPLIANFENGPAANPFGSRKGSAANVKIPPPPPPQLDFPALPILPLPEK